MMTVLMMMSGTGESPLIYHPDLSRDMLVAKDNTRGSGGKRTSHHSAHTCDQVYGLGFNACAIV